MVIWFKMKKLSKLLRGLRIVFGIIVFIVSCFGVIFEFFSYKAFMSVINAVFPSATYSIIWRIGMISLFIFLVLSYLIEKSNEKNKTNQGADRPIS